MSFCLGGVQEVMGVLIGSAVVPIALCLMWKKTNKWGAMAGAVFGQWLGLVAWLIFAKVWIQDKPKLRAAALGGSRYDR